MTSSDNDCGIDATMSCTTDLKIDLADGCKAVIDLLGQQLDNGNCATIVRVELGYFHTHRPGPAAATVWEDHAATTTARLTDDELSLLFQGMVCCLPHLKTLVVMSYFRNEAMSLPVTVLETLLRRAMRLEILFLHQVKLHGSAEDFSHMAEVLGQHPSLKRVNIHCCGGPATATTSMEEEHNNNNNNSHTAATNLDPLVCALAGLSTMDYLSLDHVPITQASMQALSESQSLRDISFYNMPEIQSCLPILLNALQTKGTKASSSSSASSPPRCHLRGLRIRSCNLDRHEADWMATMLTQNTSLESLVFYVDSWEDYGESLARALVHNTSLKRLEVGIGKNQDTDHHASGSTSTASSQQEVADEENGGSRGNEGGQHYECCNETWAGSETYCQSPRGEPTNVLTTPVSLSLECQVP